MLDSLGLDLHSLNDLENWWKMETLPVYIDLFHQIYEYLNLFRKMLKPFLE